MPNSIGPNGLQVKTQAELDTEFTDDFEDIYGSDIDLSSNTPDGQIKGIFIQSTLDNEDLIVQVNNMFDPDNAVGVILDQRVAINGIQRQAGTFTETPVTITVNQAVTLFGLDQDAQPVFTVADNAGNRFFLMQTHTFSAPGSASLTFRAENPGAVLTTPQTITVPVTVIIGVASINNPLPATTVGINEESDAQLRVRRQKSVSLASQGYLKGLLAALENINGITGAFVYENNTSVTDSNGVPGHSIWVIVAGVPTAVPSAWSSTATYAKGDFVSSGGSVYGSLIEGNVNHAVSDTNYWRLGGAAADFAIAKAIYTKRNGGCGMKGDQSFIYTQIDGNAFVVRWDDVEPETLFIAFTASSLDAVNPPNISGILAQLPNIFKPGVAQEVNVNALATAVQSIDPNTLVTQAGFSNGRTQTLNLSAIAASGAFKVNYNGHQSAAINWNDSIGTIQSKVQAVTGLAGALVTGSIASEELVFDLDALDLVEALVWVSDNTLATSVPAAITFSYDEGYSITLTPTEKNNQFGVAAENIVITPMLLQPATISMPIDTNTNFTGLGGYGTKTYSISVNNSGGTIDASTGAYTAGSSGSVSDTIKVVDELGNSATAVVSVT